MGNPLDQDGCYFIVNEQGYYVSKSYVFGKPVYAGWAPKVSHAIVYDGDLEKVKTKLKKHYKNGKKRAAGN